ncbi:MAG: 6-carboxytetrahydropterin synthase [Bdellovibrionota bacterium]
MLELAIQGHLEVAHFMPNFPEGHPNRRLHGHSYFVTVTLRSETEVDVVEDYDVFKEKLDSVLKKYDHTSCNDWKIPTEKPTMENMCVFLWKEIKEVLPKLSRITLERPTLKMTVTYEGPR